MSTRGSAEDGTCPSCATASSSCSPRRCRSRASVFLDGTLGMGGHTEAVLARLPRPHVPSASTATPQALALAGERLAAYGDRFTGVHAVYDELPAVLADLGLGTVRRRALRPRGLLAAAGRGRPRLRLPARRAAGHADGPERPASPRPRCSTPTTPPTSSGSCATTARSGSPAGSPRPIVRERQRRALHHLGPAGRAAAARRSRRPPAERRPPGQAHLPGAADRGQRRAGGAGSAPCPPRSTRSPSAAGSRSSATTRWRTG